MRISKDFYKVIEAATFLEDFSNQEDYDVESLIVDEITTHVNELKIDETKNNKV